MKLLIVSDIHANWPALRAVLEAEPDAERILCLGDLVGYGPQPVECVHWATENLQPEWMVQGNHDLAAVSGADPRCAPAYAPLAAATLPFTRRELDLESRAFLAGLQPLRTFRFSGAACCACHASPTAPLYEGLAAQSDPQCWKSELLQAHRPDFLFLGHTHHPMKARIGNTLVVNPGSVGQPRNGDPQAAYAVWQDGEITLRRTPYDIDETLHAYFELDLEGYILTALRAVLLFGAELSAHLIESSLET